MKKNYVTTQHLTCWKYFCLLFLFIINFNSSYASGVVTLSSASPTLTNQTYVAGSSSNVLFGFGITKAIGTPDNITAFRINLDKDPNTLFPVAGGVTISKNGSVIASTYVFGGTGPWFVDITLSSSESVPNPGIDQYRVIVDVLNTVTNSNGPSIANITNANISFSAVGNTVTGGTITGATINYSTLDASFTLNNGGIANSVAPSATNEPIFSFSANSNGVQSIDNIVITITSSASSLASILTNIKLKEDGNNTTYSGGGTAYTPAAPVQTGTGPYVYTLTFTPSIILPISPATDKYIYLVADIPGAASPLSGIQVDIVSVGVDDGTVPSLSSYSRTFDIGYSQSSTITIDYDGQTDIDYGEYTYNGKLMSSGDGQKIFAIKVTDADPDNKSTTLTSFTFEIGDPSNLDSLALFVSSSSSPIGKVKVATSIDINNRITFTINSAVADQNNLTFDLRASFNTTVIDNDIISILLYDATADNTIGSGLGTLGTIKTASGKNFFKVDANALLYGNIPNPINANANFSLQITAVDARGNVDHDKNGTITLTMPIGIGTFPGAGNNPSTTFSSGVATWPQLKFSLAGSKTISASAGFANKDQIIMVSSLGATVVPAPTLDLCYRKTFQTLGNIKIKENDPADFVNGGYYTIQLPNGFLFNTAVTPAIIEYGNEVTINSLGSAGNYYLGKSLMRFKFTISGTTDPNLDSITISGLEIMADSTYAPPAFGNILMKDGGSVMVLNTETEAKNHGTLNVVQPSSAGFSFEVFAFPGQTAIVPEETKFGYTTLGVLLKPAGSNPPSTEPTFSGNGISYSTTQNAYVFAPASVGVGNNYNVTFTARNASGCKVFTSKVFTVYATSISGLLTEYCVNDNTVQSLSVDPSRYDIAPYYLDWDNATSYGLGYRAKYNGEPYESIKTPNIGQTPTNIVYWKKVGYSFSNEYTISIPSYKTITSVTNNGGGSITVTSPNHGFVSGSKLYLGYYVYDAFWNIIFNIPYPNSYAAADLYTISNATLNTFDIVYNHPTTGTFTNGYGYIYIQNPQVTGASYVLGTKVVTINVPNHGLQNNVWVRVYLAGLSGNGISNNINDWYQVSGATTNSFNITTSSIVTGTWTSGYVDIFTYKVSSFTPSMASTLNQNFGSVTNIYVGFLVNQVGCAIDINNTCAPLLYSSEPVKLNQLAILDFTGLNSTSEYCANASNVTLTGNQTDGFFTGNGITDGGANNKTASFDPSSPSITKGTPFAITYSFTDNKSCLSTLSKNVTVNATPNPPTPGQSQFGYCKDDTQPLILKVSGSGSDFAWYGTSSKGNFKGNGPVYDASSVGVGSPTTQSFFATQFSLGCESNTVQVDLVINALPNADFTNVGQCVNDIITFKGPSNNITSWTWDFGDGSPAGSGATTTHIFNDSRTYTIKLDVVSTTLTGSAVCRNSSQLDNFFVGFNPVFNVKYERICDGDNTHFLQTSSPPLDQINWDFGDGITASGNASSAIVGVTNTSGTYGSPIHKYSGAGTYQASVIGKTSIGCSDTIPKAVPILIKLSPISADPYYMKTANPNGESGYWQIETTVDTLSTWAFNVPQGLELQATDSTWITNPTGNYKANDVSFINSPCFNLSGFTRPLISLDYMNDLQTGRDGAVLEYSTDSGLNWVKLGNPNTGLEWYNLNPINALGNVFGWTGRDTTFQQGFHSLSNIPVVKRDNVRFRIKFASDQDTEGEGFAFKNVNIIEKNRQVLVESFTNSSKTESINHDNVFKNLDALISPTEFVPLEYHIVPAGFGPDPINEQNTADNNARAAFYGITQGITSTQDGMLMGTLNSNANPLLLKPSFEDDFNLRSLRSSPLQIDIATSNTSDERLKIDVNITAKEIISTKQPIAVYIALVEKTVTDNNLAGENGETEFKYVLRKMLPSASGIPLKLPLSLNETFMVTESVLISEDLFSDINQMAVVAFVQNQNTDNTGRKEVLQAAIERVPAIPTVVTGIEPSIANQIKVYPNPADQYVTLQLPQPVLKQTPIKMFDVNGHQVYNTVFIEQSASTKTIKTHDLASGVYIIQIENEKGTVRKKVIIVH